MGGERAVCVVAEVPERSACYEAGDSVLGVFAAGAFSATDGFACVDSVLPALAVAAVRSAVALMAGRTCCVLCGALRARVSDAACLVCELMAARLGADLHAACAFCSTMRCTRTTYADVRSSPHVYGAGKQRESHHGTRGSCLTLRSTAVSARGVFLGTPRPCRPAPIAGDHHGRTRKCRFRIGLHHAALLRSACLRAAAGFWGKHQCGTLIGSGSLAATSSTARSAAFTIDSSRQPNVSAPDS